MCGTSLCENREILGVAEVGIDLSPCREGESREPMMHAPRKSDGSVVPTKPANAEGSTPSGERAEGRDSAKGNAGQPHTGRTQRREVDVSPGLARVREVAKRDRKARFTALLHHVTIERLRRSYDMLKRDAAVGVDGVSWTEYGTALEDNLRDLHDRLHRGTYRAKPSRRVYIPKPDGRQRPLGIASLEDKIAQRAVVEVLNAIFEVDFRGFSYGFRPGRGAHDALDALTVGIQRGKVNWVLDADIRGFFDSVDHGWLMQFVEHRIADPRVVRLIRKWLKAGVMEDGSWSVSEEGTPQGATISPLLANLYLHHVLDLWADAWRKRQAVGQVLIVRYADDFIIGFELGSDAERFLTELRERLGTFSLELHPEKTRLIEFGRHAAANRRDRGEGKPESFTFLGFTHLCGRGRNGGFYVLRQTRTDRMRAKLQVVKAALRRHRHAPVREQGRWLGQVLRGYFGYFAVPGNYHALRAFYAQVKWYWMRALRHRAQSHHRHSITYPRMDRLASKWLPMPRIQHPWPMVRFAAKHPRWEPSALVAPAGFCAGGAR